VVSAKDQYNNWRIVIADEFFLKHVSFMQRLQYLQFLLVGQFFASVTLVS